MSEAPTKTDETLTFECDLDAPPQKVWRAIATPEIREAWLGEPEAGRAEVARSDPGSRLDLVWPSREGETLVSFEIDAAEDGGTHLTIVHRSLANACVVPFRSRTTRDAAPRAWRMAA